MHVPIIVDTVTCTYMFVFGYYIRSYIYMYHIYVILNATLPLKRLQVAPSITGLPLAAWHWCFNNTTVLLVPVLTERIHPRTRYIPTCILMRTCCMHTMTYAYVYYDLVSLPTLAQMLAAVSLTYILEFWFKTLLH